MGSLLRAIANSREAISASRHLLATTKSATDVRLFKSAGLFRAGALALQHERTGTMATTTTRGRSQDRKQVAGGQEHEVRYEAEKEGASKSEVKDAVKKVGNSRKKVEGELEDK